MKTETLKNVALIIVIIVLAFVTYKMVFKSDNSQPVEPRSELIVLPPDTSQTTVVQPTTPIVSDPCAQIKALTEALNQAKEELRAAENKVETAALDLQTAIKK